MGKTQEKLSVYNTENIQVGTSRNILLVLLITTKGQALDNLDVV